MTVGTGTMKANAREMIARSRMRAALIPDLLVEARRIANTMTPGWHGRKKRGIGENFWQFRPFQTGENFARIDWRRSGRDDNLYIRDNEWEAVHTIWLWADESESMMYKSRFAQTSKHERALVLALAILEVLARSGERVGYLGLTAPITHRHAAERIASAMMWRKEEENKNIPKAHANNARSDLVLISDFLDPMDDIVERIDAISSSNAKGHLVHIIDPAEESFPYSGRMEFVDPERGNKFTAGKAEEWATEYVSIFKARHEALKYETAKRGWSYMTHHTDRLASQALANLHMIMSNTQGRS